jgi:hypothetical protein
MEDDILIPVEERGSDLLSIIECCLSVLVTLSDMEEKSYDEEVEDIIKVKVRTYKIILQAEDKLFKQIKNL